MNGAFTVAEVWLTITVSSPLFFVSVDSKGFNFPVSPLDATLVGGHVSVASKGVAWSKTVQNAVCFVSVAGRGLRPQTGRRKEKRQSGDWRPGLQMCYYQSNTIRRETLFVKGKTIWEWAWQVPSQSGLGDKWYT
jgi:hypothetical protein